MDIVGPLETLAADLAAHEGIEAATTDPAKLRTPGVLVQLAAVEADLLNGYTLGLRLLLVVPNNGHRRSWVALGELLTAVASVIDPQGPATPVGVKLTATGPDLPALSVPVILRVTN